MLEAFYYGMKNRLQGLFSSIYYVQKEVLTYQNKKLIMKVISAIAIIVLLSNLIYSIYSTNSLVENNKQNLMVSINELITYDGEVDLTYIANLSKADFIIIEKGDTTYNIYHREGQLLKKYRDSDKNDYYTPLYTANYKDWYISNNFNLVIKLTNSDLQYHSKYNVLLLSGSIPSIVIYNFFYTFLLTVFFIFLSLTAIVYVASKVRISELIATASNEAMLQVKNSQKFVESMHHEVKTPLAVLNSTFNKMEVLINDLWENTENYDYIKERLGEDKQIIEDLTVAVSFNFELIYNILDKQKNNRAIRFSNGNYNLFDLLQHSCENLRWDTKIKYSYDIDNRFKLLSNKTLANEDFVNIFINHIKNSLEANANMIKIHLQGVKDDKAIILLADNGSGIPDSVKDMIYLPSFSTKKQLKDSDNQGVGMYLCHSLLEEAKGSESVKYSDSQGTVFEIILPITDYIEKEKQ